MNELSVAHGLLKDIEEESKRHGVSRVRRIHVQIGNLRGVVPEALALAFEAISEDTIAEGAELKIGVIPARGRCDNCNIDFDVEIDPRNFSCPQCGRIAAELNSGKELKITLFRGTC